MHSLQSKPRRGSNINITSKTWQKEPSLHSTDWLRALLGSVYLVDESGSARPAPNGTLVPNAARYCAKEKDKWSIDTDFR